MSEQAPNMGIVQWHPDHCPRARWLRMCVQLFHMQRSIADAKRYTPNVIQ